MVTHEGSMDVWDALAEQRRHQLPPGMTVADIERQRDGWDEAFDPREDMLTTRWGPVSNCGMDFGQ